MVEEKKVRAISPYEALEYFPIQREREIQEAIRFFNSVIYVHLSELELDGFVLIYDGGEKRYVPWEAFHEEIVRRYADAGWIVERYVGDDQPQPCYKFSLPGVILKERK